MTFDRRKIFTQSVKAAKHRDSRTIIPAFRLLEIPENEFYALRRECVASINASTGTKPPHPLLTCAICGTAVRINLHGSGNRFFVHAEDAAFCPWYQGGRASQEQSLAAEFLYEKEGALHRELKNFIADQLNADPDINGSAVVQEPVWGEVLQGQWRRPDVRCTWRGLNLVFELQLGYTNLREVVARDSFYKAEGSFVIWIFHSADKTRAVHKDEKFFNKRNLFVLDEESREESRQKETLVLQCRYERTTELFSSLVDSCEQVFVRLSDLSYPPDTFRPYFFDYDEGRARAKIALQRTLEARLENEKKVRLEREASSAPYRAARVDGPHVIGASYSKQGSNHYFEHFKRNLDIYQLSVEPFPNRLRHLAGPALEFPEEKDRAIATESIKSPLFDYLIFARGLELATPYGTRGVTLGDWANERLRGANENLPSLAFHYFSAWYAYPPNQPPSLQKDFHEIFDRIIGAIKSGDQKYIPDPRFKAFIAALFPRIAQVSHIKIG